MEKIDFLAIGDIVTDAFIHIKDAEAYCDLDHENCKLCVRFGDKVPFESVTVCHAVGNSPNAAVAAARLGLNTALSAVVGNDDEGKICLDTLKKEGILTDYIGISDEFPTNYHYVLWYDVDRTILIKHALYKREMPNNLPEIGYIYLSSLGEGTEQFHYDIASFVAAHPETKLAFQPGTFQMKLGKEVLAEVYKNTEILFFNKEEAQRVLGTPDEHDVKTLIKNLHNLGPKYVVITMGPDGLIGSDGESFYQLPIYPDIAAPLERTGAGDATSATITSALALGKSFEEALLWGPINSMNVVQHIGAQEGLLKREKFDEYLKNAPANYKTTKI